MPEEEGVDLLCAVQKFRLVPFGILLGARQGTATVTRLPVTVTKK